MFIYLYHINYLKYSQHLKQEKYGGENPRDSSGGWNRHVEVYLAVSQQHYFPRWLSIYFLTISVETLPVVATK